MPQLRSLLNGINLQNAIGPLDIDIRAIRVQAQNINAGDLYIAIPGNRHDGHDFIDLAINKGAVCVLHEKPVTYPNPNVTYIQVENSRRASALLASKYYGNPSQSMKLTAITGTNGKTTTSYLLHTLLKQNKIKPGLLGTITYLAGDQSIGAGLTTPAPLQLHHLFKTFKNHNVEHCVMEVSSHALKQERVFGIDFDTAVFTNLSHDHLDYHPTFDDYADSKLSLFRGLGANSWAIVNRDDPFSSVVIKESLTRQIMTCSLKDPGADVFAEQLIVDNKGLRIKINSPQGPLEIESALFGKHNAENILAAVAFGIVYNMHVDDIASGIYNLKSVSGRFEPVQTDLPFPVIVDFAHTPDALQKTLTTARTIFGKKIITVFGCGGDRDREKRPVMGRIASEMSDQVVLTSDNPRNEDPIKIINEIESGMLKSSLKHIIPDRRKAIHYALSIADEISLVLIAGKGHETRQDIGGEIVPFDDRDCVLTFNNENI